MAAPPYRRTASVVLRYLDPSQADAATQWTQHDYDLCAELLGDGSPCKYGGRASTCTRQRILFSSHFTFREGESGRPRVTLNLFLGEAHPVSSVGSRERVWIRQSVSEFFSVPAERVRYEGDECVRSLETGTTLRFRKSRTEVDVGLREPCPLLDLIELIRDLVLKLEQESGKVAIHAMSCLRHGKRRLSLAPKGGKK